MGLPKLFADTLQYRLVRPIAQGGMGCVYEAVQLGACGFQKRVALKIIREEYARLPQFRRNFLGEAKLVADLVHPNIVQTYHLAYSDNRYLMVMEYVEGRNLEQFLLQHNALERPVPCRIAAFIIARIARALLYAHRQTDATGNHLGIVHRDVSPKNIMLSFSGDIKLTDFGIAKAFNLMYGSEGEVIAGRSDYLSPEQARMEVTDARADLFSCGVLLLEMLLGYNYFQGSDAAQSRQRICSAPLPDIAALRPDVEGRLVDITQRALQRDREQRYSCADDLMVDLEDYLFGGGMGMTHERMGTYMRELYATGDAYEDDITELPADSDAAVTVNKR